MALTMVGTVETLTRRRLASGGVTVGTDGRPVRGVATDSTFEASVQPGLSGQDLQKVPEERRTEAIRVYTEAELRPANQHADEPSDRVIRNGITYEVFTVSDYSAATYLSHYKCICLRLTEGQS